jgi:signal transduction histidine kinase
VARGRYFRQEILISFPNDGRAFDFSMRPVTSPAGEVIAIVFEAIELTERRAAEGPLRKGQAMEAVGQLKGGLAHAFNNLLTGIIDGLRTMHGLSCAIPVIRQVRCSACASTDVMPCQRAAS